MIQRKDFHPTGKLWWVWVVLFWVIFASVMVAVLA
jgi:hypothetical protein